MSKFRNNTKKKIDVSGKTPSALLFQPIAHLVTGLSYQVTQKMKALDPKYADFIDNVNVFSRDASYARRNDDQSKQYFLAVTKSTEKEFTYVDTTSRLGCVVSVGLLRSYIKDSLPIILTDRYTNQYRGDRRKKESKSKDWVKPDFKEMISFAKVLDVIHFVKDSVCDVVECSGNARVFGGLVANGSGYRWRRNNANRVPAISQRFEVTNWFNTARKCYYDSYDSALWAKNNPRLLRENGMDYDTIMSEVIMTMD
tara:strand:- start:15 stop:779 length:765 start_codon:yes stop_codon:yes gene_type:complete